MRIERHEVIEPRQEIGKLSNHVYQLRMNPGRAQDSGLQRHITTPSLSIIDSISEELEIHARNEFQRFPGYSFSSRSGVQSDLNAPQYRTRLVQAEGVPAITTGLLTSPRSVSVMSAT